MAVSATAARVYINVPDALRLNQVALDTTFAGVRALNATAVRIPVAWKAVQPTHPTYFNWVATDLAVARAVAAGLRVMLVLAPPKPFWAATIDPTNFAAFAGAAAVRYKGRVAEYQVWDEPNVLASWPGATMVVPSDYTLVLKASYTAIKTNDPAALVIFGGLRAIDETTTITLPGPLGGPLLAKTVRTKIEPAEFLAEIYVASQKYFDILAYHPLSITTDTRPFPPAPSGDSIAGHDRLFASMTYGASVTAVAARTARGLGQAAPIPRVTTVTPASKKVYWTAVGYELAQFTQYQQAYYLDTMRWLAQTRPEVTGMGIVSFRDYLV